MVLTLAILAIAPVIGFAALQGGMEFSQWRKGRAAWKTGAALHGRLAPLCVDHGVGSWLFCRKKKGQPGCARVTSKAKQLSARLSPTPCEEPVRRVVEPQHAVEFHALKGGVGLRVR